MKKALFVFFFLLLSSKAYGTSLRRILKKQISKQLPVICKNSENKRVCDGLLENLLEALGYNATVKDGKIVKYSCFLIKRVTVKPAQEEKELSVLSQLLEGQKFSQQLLQMARAVAVYKLHSCGYLDASVNFKVKKTKEGYFITVLVNAGRAYRIDSVKLVAPTQIKEKLLKLLKLKSGQVLKPPQVSKLIEKIQKKFVELGYYNFQIEFKVRKKKDGLADVIIYVNPGKRYYVIFKGNELIDSKKLKKLLTFVRDKSFDEFELELSKKRILEFYKNNGFPWANVKAEIRSSNSEVKIYFLIKEGKKVIIKKLKSNLRLPEIVKHYFRKNLKDKPYSQSKVRVLENETAYAFKGKGFLNATARASLKDSVLFLNIRRGNLYILSGISFKGFKPKWEIKKDVPIYPSFFDELKQKILSKLLQNGYLDAKLQIKKTFVKKRDKTLVNATVIVDKGPVYRVGFVVIDGIKRIRYNNIYQILILKPNQVYQKDKVLMQYMLLADTRLFSDIKLLESRYKNYVNVIFKTKESPLLSLKGFVGYSTRSKGFLTLTSSINSPIGAGVRGDLMLSYRNKEGYEAIFSLSKLAFYRAQNTLTYSFIRKKDIYESFSVTRTINRFAFKRKMSKTADLETGFEFKDETVSSISYNNTSERGVYLKVKLDRRKPKGNPEKGGMFSIKTSYYAPLLGGDTNYLLTDVNLAGERRINRRLILAARLGSGVIEPFEGEVPIQDRFFLGGAESVRGYKFGTISPKDKLGRFVGGDVYILTSLELRLSVKKNFQVAVFTDSGNVFAKPSQIKAELYSSVGLGFRYITPVGPLRIDYGYKLKKIPGQGPGRFHISFGFPF